MTTVALAPARSDLEGQLADTRQSLFDHVSSNGRLAVVKAPPGSGKTRLLLETVAHAVGRGSRVAIAALTNAQADDMCRRLAAKHRELSCIRLGSSGSTPPDGFPRGIRWETRANQLPHAPLVVVGTAAKWGLAQLTSPFDFVFVDEAWQLGWADFMLLGQVSARFVLIGDPGQISPVVAVDVSRWETAPLPPHEAAPEVILKTRRKDALLLSLPGTRRLPWDTTDLVQRFYDFPFASWAGPGERHVRPRKGSSHRFDRVLDRLVDSTAVAATLPTPAEGPPLECDDEIATLAAQLVQRVLDRDPIALVDGEETRLRPEDIGLCATHRVMNTAMQLALPTKLQGRVRADTPERWQGLERKLMIVVHPLSGVVHPSSFDLETGRLCVMASRHQAGLVIVSRDHVGETLDQYLPSAQQAVGRPDTEGRGHAQNTAFWSALADSGRVCGLHHASPRV
jgi:hypothetical protein